MPSAELIRIGVHVIKRRFLGWRDPPVELPSESVIEATVVELFQLGVDATVMRPHEAWRTLVEDDNVSFLFSCPNCGWMFLGHADASLTSSEMAINWCQQVQGHFHLEHHWDQPAWEVRRIEGPDLRR